MSAEAEWTVGDRLHFPPRFRQVWVVREVVERGVIVSTLEKDDHRHLLEWVDLAIAAKL